LTARGAAKRQPVVLYQPRDQGAGMPLGLLALGSWLEGRHVVIVDGRFELAPEARVVELARSALLLGVTARTGAPLREALRVSRAARAVNPQLAVLWGGPHASLDAGSCFATGVVDGCVPGAGEEALQEAVAILRSGRPLASAPGLVVPGGAAVAPAPPPTRLWPRADYSLLDVERYFDERGVRSLDYCSSRGGRDSPDWLGLRTERVLAELLELAERYRVSEFRFQDEDFFGDPVRMEGIAEGLIDTGAPFTWRAGARPEDVVGAPPEGLRRLVASGCRGLQMVVGREPRERLLEAGARLHKAGLAARFVFDVSEDARGEGLASAVAAARALSAMDGRFETPIRRHRVPVPLVEDAEPRSIEHWAALSEAPWASAVMERRLSRAAFFFAEAQRAPGSRLGKHLVRVLALLRVRLGFFGLDLERRAVETSALLRTGRPRPVPGAD
jgi:hypothetical protein